MGRILLAAFFSIYACFASFSQNKGTLKETFHEAEFYILYEDYNEALALYLDLYNRGIENSYIQHRIGECYLQIPGQKTKAIPFLERASKGISDKIKEGSFKETKAPYRTLFYLACAYQTNNELDKAIETFKKFEKLVSDDKNFNIDYVEKQIQSCNAAKKLMENPLHVEELNLGNNINNEYSNIRPVISANEESMVFLSQLKFYDAIFYTKKEGNSWTNPVNITLDLKTDGNLYPCFLSADGKTLLLHLADEFNSDIYMSRFENNKWTVPVKLNKNINSKNQETFASLSQDGKTLYFVSDRKGGFGGLDIYKSNFNELEKDWGKAINLGREINTPFNEENPILCEDGKTLYFSSQGHYNMGGFDVFYTENLEENIWSKPVNVGYPVNSTDDNLFYYPLNNGEKVYISKYDQNGFGQADIMILQLNNSAQK